MGRPRTVDIETATHERILASAEATFARAGYEGARLEDIAGAAGMRRPSLLYHFPTKEALYAATVDRVFAALRASLVAAMQGEGDFPARLDGTVANYAGFLAERPDLARIFVREVLDGSGPGAALVERQVVPLLDMAEEFLRTAGRGRIRPEVDLRAAILQVVGGVLLYAIAGPLRAPLWNERRRVRRGAEDAFVPAVQTLARTLILADTAPATGTRAISRPDGGRERKIR